MPSNKHTTEYLHKTLMATGYGKSLCDPNVKRLEVAKGIIARLRDNIEDQKATITQLTASNTSRQNIIDEMIEDGCCRAFVDEIMSDAEIDIGKALKETKEAKNSFLELSNMSLQVRRDYGVSINSICMPIYWDICERLRPNSIPIGTRIRCNVFIGEGDDLDELERGMLGVVQGSPHDAHLRGERRAFANNIVESIQSGDENWIELDEPFTCENGECPNYHFWVEKLAVWGHP